MTITALPTPPLRTDPTNFAVRADAFLAALPTFVTEANATATAMNLNATTDTSASSVLIGTGSKSFTVSAAKSFQPGMWLSIADTAAPTVNSLVGQVDSYNSATGALVVTVPANGALGSGTKTAWTITLTAKPPAEFVSVAMQPVTSAATLAAARTALDIKQLQSIDYTLAANALTLKLNPTNLDFRSTSLISGAPVNVSNAAQLTTVISSGSTAGAVSAVQSDIILLAINNAGTMELAWTNLAGGLNLDETGVITTVAEGGAGAADSNNVIYSTTARTGVAYRVVGLFRSTQTTAGTWAQVPTLVQPMGGQALAALAVQGQTWTNVTASRALGTTYYNTTGIPIDINVFGTCNADFSFNAQVGGVLVYGTSSYATVKGTVVNASIPPGSSYSVNTTGGTLIAWNEKR